MYLSRRKLYNIIRLEELNGKFNIVSGSFEIVPESRHPRTIQRGHAAQTLGDGAGLASG